jgi:hypothetical protein
MKAFDGSRKLLDLVPSCFVKQDLQGICLFVCLFAEHPSRNLHPATFSAFYNNYLEIRFAEILLSIRSI